MHFSDDDDLPLPPRPPPTMSNSDFPHCQFHINESTTTGRLPGRRRVNLRAIPSHDVRNRKMCRGFHSSGFDLRTLVFNNLKMLLMIFLSLQYIQVTGQLLEECQRPLVRLALNPRRFCFC